MANSLWSFATLLAKKLRHQIRNKLVLHGLDVVPAVCCEVSEKTFMEVDDLKFLK